MSHEQLTDQAAAAIIGGALQASQRPGWNTASIPDTHRQQQLDRGQRVLGGEKDKQCLLCGVTGEIKPWFVTVDGVERDFYLCLHCGFQKPDVACEYLLREAAKLKETSDHA